MLATAGRRRTLSNISFTVRSEGMCKGSNVDFVLSKLKTYSEEKEKISVQTVKNMQNDKHVNVDRVLIG